MQTQLECTHLAYTGRASRLRLLAKTNKKKKLFIVSGEGAVSNLCRVFSRRIMDDCCLDKIGRQIQCQLQSLMCVLCCVVCYNVCAVYFR